MSLEIERRFRLNARPPEDVLAKARKVKIAQHYIQDTGGWVMRVRQTSCTLFNPRYHLTMKRPVEGSAFSDHEIEVEIGAMTYLHLGLNHSQGAMIEKARWSIPHGDLMLEFDLFEHPALFGLMLLEVELPDEDHGINMPAWFDGFEITGDKSYSNFALSRRIDDMRRGQLRPA